MSDLSSFNKPPVAYANGYSGYNPSPNRIAIPSGDRQVVYMAPQVAWHNISVVLSDPSHTTTEVSLSSEAIIEDDITNSTTNALWVTVNVAAAAFFTITSQVRALRFTAAADIKVEVIN